MMNPSNRGIAKRDSRVPSDIGGGEDFDRVSASKNNKVVVHQTFGNGSSSSSIHLSRRCYPQDSDSRNTSKILKRRNCSTEVLLSNVQTKKIKFIDRKERTTNCSSCQKNTSNKYTQPIDANYPTDESKGGVSSLSLLSPSITTDFVPSSVPGEGVLDSKIGCDATGPSRIESMNRQVDHEEKKYEDMLMRKTCENGEKHDSVTQSEGDHATSTRPAFSIGGGASGVDLVCKVRFRGFDSSARPQRDWRDSIEKLHKLGFVSKDINRVALELTDGNIDNAVRWILEQQDVFKAQDISLDRSPVKANSTSTDFTNIVSDDDGSKTKNNDSVFDPRKDVTSRAADFSKLPSDDATALFGRRATNIDFWATSPTPSFATLPLWLRELLVNPAFRYLCSIRRSKLRRNGVLGPMSGIIKVVEEWDTLSGKDRKAFYDQSQSPLQDQIAAMRTAFETVREALTRSNEMSSQSASPPVLTSRYSQEWSSKANAVDSWNAGLHHAKFSKYRYVQEVGGREFLRVDFPLFWKRIKSMFRSLCADRIAGPREGSRDAQRRGLLEEEIGNFFRCLDPAIKTASELVVESSNECKDNADAVLCDAISKSIYRLRDLAARNRERREILRARCLSWADDARVSKFAKVDEIVERWYQHRAWSRVRKSLLRGVVLKRPGFNVVKEVVPPSWTISAQGRPTREPSKPVSEESDTICAVCFDGVSTDDNQIVFCERCDIALHQSCAGIVEIPSGDYYCDGCAYLKKVDEESLGRIVPQRVTKPQCSFCPIGGGALKQIENSVRWGHVICALWHPEVSIANTREMCPLRIAPKPRCDVVESCACCAQSMGRLVCCSKTGCDVKFHPYCAWYAGYDMRATKTSETAACCAADAKGIVMRDVTFFAFCPAHSGSECNQIEQQRIRAQYCKELLPPGLRRALQSNGVTPGRRDASFNGLTTTDAPDSSATEEEYERIPSRSSSSSNALSDGKDYYDPSSDSDGQL